MEKIILNDKKEIPVLGLGTYLLVGQEGERAMEDALELGYRMLDTAHLYGNEEEVGNVVNRSNVSREDLFITTKLFSDSRSYSFSLKGVEKSLKRMKLDYLDMVLVHEPYNEAVQMYKALEDLNREGLIKSIGISNFNKKLYLDFIKEVHVIPAINQVETHVFNQRKDLQKEMILHGTKMMSWSPFIEGKDNYFENEELLKISRKYGKSVAQITLRFFYEKGIILIPKSKNKDRLKENINIFDFRLKKEDYDKMSEMDMKKTYFGWYDN